MYDASGKEPSYGLTFHATFSMAGSITSISSPTHELAMEYDGSKGRADLKAPSAQLDKDLIVLVKAKSEPARAVLEKSRDGSSAVALAVVPRFELDEVKTELVFIVDCRLGTPAFITALRNGVLTSLSGLVFEDKILAVSFQFVVDIYSCKR